MRRFPALLALLLTAAAASVAPAQDDLDPGPVAERLIDRYGEDRGSLQAFFGVVLSEERLNRLEAFQRSWLVRIREAPFDDLDLEGKVDLVLLRNHVEHRIRMLAFERGRRQETLEILPFAPALVELEEARRRMEELPAAAAAKILDAARESVVALQGRVESGLSEKPADDALTPSPVIALRAARRIGELKDMLKGWFGSRDGYEPDFGWWVRKPNEALGKALDAYRKVLREKVAGVKGDDPPLVGDPIGRDALLDDLRHEMIAYSPEELIAVAEEQFAWCEDEGKKVSAELGFGDDWARAVEHVKTRHVAPGEQPSVVAGQARDAIRFVEERDLVTIPALCKDAWHLDMLSAKRQKVAPFALYSRGRMLVAYPTESMGHGSKLMSMRGNNEHFTRIVTPHELIPGHHLQTFMAHRHRPHRRVFRTPFLVEGWALHWELLLWDKGYARNPLDKVGMLFWRKHRAARIIVSLKFHLGQMTPDEMVAFLEERVGLEHDGATAEVRRYIGSRYGPLYQCAYMLGGLQIRALHRELVGGGKMTDRRFHDTVLRQNSVPVEMIRAVLTDTPPERDHTASWRFVK